MKTINLSAAVIAVALSTFAAASPAFAQDAPAAKVGDKVDFDLTLTGNAGEMTAIHKQ